MRKITKNFCNNNPVLLAYYRESRRYSPIDIRIRQTGMKLLNTSRSIPLYIKSLSFTQIQDWIEQYTYQFFLHEIRAIKVKRIRTSPLLTYQI